MLKQFMIIEEVLTTTFLLLILTAGYVDFQKRRIPDRLVFAVFLVAFCSLFFTENPDVMQKIAGTFAVSIPMLLTDLCVPGAFGGGDVKLMAACGLFLGAGTVFYSFFYALILGGLYSVFLIMFKNKSLKTELAFGPFLAAGIVLRLIFQDILC